MIPPLEGMNPIVTRCKGRVDYLSERCIVDLKTVRDASPDAIARHCASYQAHVQAAFYVDGVKAATGRALPYVLLAVEATEPHVVQAYEVPLDALELGRQRYTEWLAKRRAALDSGEWSGYAKAALPLELPRWAVPKDVDFSEEVE